MIDILIVAIVLVIVGGAAFYIYMAKKSGTRCIGCPDGKTCGGHCAGCQCNCSHK